MLTLISAFQINRALLHTLLFIALFFSILSHYGLGGLDGTQLILFESKWIVFTYLLFRSFDVIQYSIQKRRFGMGDTVFL